MDPQERPEDSLGKDDRENDDPFRPRDAAIGIAVIALVSIGAWLMIWYDKRP